MYKYNKYNIWILALLINAIVFISNKTLAQVGVNTATPKNTSHVHGTLQVDSTIALGGNATTAGNRGAEGQVLTSAGPNAPARWISPSSTPGAVRDVYSAIGTSQVIVAQGTSADVPGVTFTHVVPTGETHQLMITCTGYARSSAITSPPAIQGVFSLLQNGAKISSAFAAALHGNNLSNLPIPVTFQKLVTLTAGTYTFKVTYKAWANSAEINHVPSDYSGYDADSESMKTRISAIAFQQ